MQHTGFGRAWPGNDLQTFAEVRREWAVTDAVEVLGDEHHRRVVAGEDASMNIGIIGTGEMSRILGTAWGVNNHAICFGAGDISSALVAAAHAPHARAGTHVQAVEFGDVVVVALPWREALTTVPSLREHLADKTLIDCSNPVDETGEFQSADCSSFAEQLAHLLPETVVVKALNGVTPEALRYVLSKGSPFINGQPTTVFYCSDDREAKRMTEGLIGELNLEPVDVGELRAARLIEAVGVLAEKLRKSEALGSGVLAINAVHELRDHSFMDRFM
jgi:8-hydroxy-5-deazaflavin:NADPH oxidoreductase